jgi:hypothetical protein
MSEPAPDELDRVRAREPWPPRYSGGGHHEGEIIPHRFSIFSWLKAVPGVVAPFLSGQGGKEVPGEFWTVDEREGQPVAVIACPCGAEPVIGWGRIDFCGGEDCGRVFFYMGESVRAVTLSEDQVDALAEASDA